MSISEELRKLGYRFEYERTGDGERTEVWTNEEAGMAVRIEWMKVHDGVEGEDWWVDGRAGADAPAP